MTETSNARTRCETYKVIFQREKINTFFAGLGRQITYMYESNIGQEMILFNNKEILVGKRPIFLKSWFDSGIVSIQDILSEKGVYPFKNSNKVTK